MGAFITMAKGRTAKEAARVTLERKAMVKVVACACGNHVQVAMDELGKKPFNDPGCRKMGAVPMGGECWLLFGRM